MVASVVLYSDRMSRMASALAETGPPHERADSRRKRLRLIEAARLVVAEKGLEAGAAEIAARAEVGVGTLYRRFGTKEALVKDILMDGIAEIQAAVDRALAAPDPWTGLTLFLTDFSTAQTANRGLHEFTAADPSAFSPELHDDTMKLRHAVTELTERAHRAGVLRKDVTWRDIVVLSLASVDASTCLGVHATDTQPERTAAILLAGLRADDAASPLPGEPPVDLLAC
jgi:AcrR family transcriptional regulator